MLQELLSYNGDYALALGPGFFRFYAHCGILSAFEELNVFNPSHISGSSAGALVGSMVASGYSPSDVSNLLFDLKREDIWDLGGTFFGLLKGELFQKKMEETLPKNVQDFSKCKIPLSVTAWDIFSFQTRSISSGSIATAVRASCCVPVMFAPVMIENRPHVDAGFMDEAGIMGLTGVPISKLIVNIVCSQKALAASLLPPQYKDCRLLTLVMEDIPQVTPFNMKENGPIAYHVARLATLQAFRSGHIQQPTQNHWIAYIEGNTVTTLTLFNALKKTHSHVDISTHFNITDHSMDETATNNTDATKKTASDTDNKLQNISKVDSSIGLNIDDANNTIVSQQNSTQTMSKIIVSETSPRDANDSIISLPSLSSSYQLSSRPSQVMFLEASLSQGGGRGGGGGMNGLMSQSVRSLSSYNLFPSTSVNNLPTNIIKNMDTITTMKVNGNTKDDQVVSKKRTRIDSDTSANASASDKMRDEKKNTNDYEFNYDDTTTNTTNNNNNNNNNNRNMILNNSVKDGIMTTLSKETNTTEFSMNDAEYNHDIVVYDESTQTTDIGIPILTTSSKCITASSKRSTKSPISTILNNLNALKATRNRHSSTVLGEESLKSTPKSSPRPPISSITHGPILRTRSMNKRMRKTM